MKKGQLFLVGTLLLAVMFGVVPGLYAQEEYTNIDVAFPGAIESGANDTNNAGQGEGQSVDASESIASITSPQPSSTTSVPTMNEWGMIVFVLLAAFLAVLTMRRRRD